MIKLDQLKKVYKQELNDFEYNLDTAIRSKSSLLLNSKSINLNVDDRQVCMITDAFKAKYAAGGYKLLLLGNTLRVTVITSLLEEGTKDYV